MDKYQFVYQRYQVPETYQLTYDDSTGNVFIGAGYNLSTHSYNEVVEDLTQAGFDRFTVLTLAEAANKTGIEAQNWVQQNRFLIISEQQHQNLFEFVTIPDFEENLNIQLEKCKENIQDFPDIDTSALSDTQKQLLFNFVTNNDLLNHDQLAKSVIEEDWDSVYNELRDLQYSQVYGEVSQKMLSDIFQNSSASLNDNTVSWNLSAETLTGDEHSIELKIPTNYDFTYNQEIGHQGQSLVPHFPGGKSGVTIGPGYDMGHRTPEEIYTDLTAAGIDPETARVLMEAAGKTGIEAQQWAMSHHEIHISEEQQRYMFYNLLVPEYEHRAQEQLQSFLEKHPEVDPASADWDNLSDKQREMLFDFTYNAGLDKFPTFVKAVLEEDWDNAYHSFERYSAGELLSYRNESFYEEFLDEQLHYGYNGYQQQNETPDDYGVGV